ncbi:EamA/RhaT family transporter [Nakamurella silvestris]|nr:EamA/RhaT family transporter [Nakamurella silvestris]
MYSSQFERPESLSAPISATSAVPGAGRGAASSGPLLLTLLAGILWGTGGLTGSLLSEHAGTGAVTNGAIRLLGGGLIVTAVMAVTGMLSDIRWDRTIRRRLLVIGLASAGFQTAYFCAVALTSVSLATLVTIGLCPVLVTIASAIRDRRRPEPITVVTTSVAVGGLILLIGFPGENYGLAALLAFGLCFLSACGFTVITLVTATPLPGLPSMAAAGPAFVIGGLVLIPVVAIVSAIDGSSLGAQVSGIDDWKSILLVLAFALIPTALAYTAYFRGVEGTAPTAAALSALLEPLTATVLAALILHERMGTLAICGAVVIGAAVAVRAIHSGRRPAAG